MNMIAGPFDQSDLMTSPCVVANVCGQKCIVGGPWNLRFMVTVNIREQYILQIHDI